MAARKRTGAQRRQMQRKFDKPQMPDDRGIKTAQDAAEYLRDLGRWELARGYSPRVTPREDLAAHPLIADACRHHARELAERALTAAIAAGAAIIAHELQDTVSRADADEQPGDGSTPAQMVVARVVKFIGVRRRGVARLLKGERNRAMRHAFGISKPLANNSPQDVLEALVALLAGRKEHEGTPAARLITEADVKTARAYEAQLQELMTRQGARRSSSAETARMRDVLHAALELFYDRFAAAVDVAFEADDDKRVAMLSLVPRRKERRVVKGEAPAEVAAEPAVQKAGNE